MPKIDIIKPYNSEKPVNYKFTSQICTTSCSSSDPGLDRSQTAKCKKNLFAPDILMLYPLYKGLCKKYYLLRIKLTQFTDIYSIYNF